jgi:DNA-binding NtrC family response regulator
VERAREHGDIELLITDFHLSDGKLGTDVMQSVQEVLGRRVKTVLITGDTSSAIHQVVHDSWVRFASKPIRADELLGLLGILAEESLPG